MSAIGKSPSHDNKRSTGQEYANKRVSYFFELATSKSRQYECNQVLEYCWKLSIVHKGIKVSYSFS